MYPTLLEDSDLSGDLILVCGDATHLRGDWYSVFLLYMGKTQFAIFSLLGVLRTIELRLGRKRDEGGMELTCGT
ncbi:hypothetical protein BPAE_0045g00310 [Botrytis paeoniae]|uniref:Uncharacterized protein n=1 Tax=Botrytis paeoniae TaxID=278948 RepID=A0A4Z1FR20_9HELO|nr:hypothetical protein BPAE_0045g00310 [Botrytis paeoniae]